MYIHIPHRTHGAGILTYLWSIFVVNVGKYAGDMDPMGLKVDEVGTGCTSSISCNSRWGCN